MKKRLIIFCAIMMLVVSAFVGCGKSETVDSVANVDKQEKYTITMPHVVSRDNPVHVAAEQFKKQIEEKSNGRIEVKIYPNGELASTDRELTEMIRNNTCQIVHAATNALGAMHPELQRYNVFDVPYLFPSEQAVMDFVDSEFGDELRELTLKETGLKMYTAFIGGSNKISSNKGPIESPEDLKGQDIRVLTAPATTALVSALGANPTPMAYSEVFTGLQQGTVDGMMTRTALYVSDGFMEVQDYIGCINSNYFTYFILLNNEFYESLPEDLQSILDECMVDLIEETNRLEAENEINALNTMREAGLTVSEYNDEEMKKFSDLGKTTWDELKEVSGGSEYFDKVVEFVRDY